MTAGSRTVGTIRGLHLQELKVTFKNNHVINRVILERSIWAQHHFRSPWKVKRVQGKGANFEDLFMFQ